LTRGLVDIITQFLITHKQWTFQTSSFEMLKIFVKVKINNLSQHILLHHLEHARTISMDSPFGSVKIAAINFIETTILVFPDGISSKWSDIRDTLR
jgi:hypothetical protein